VFGRQREKKWHENIKKRKEEKKKKNLSLSQ
jgi:hypothetical protein